MAPAFSIRWGRSFWPAVLCSVIGRASKLKTSFPSFLRRQDLNLEARGSCRRRNDGSQGRRPVTLLRKTV